MYIAKIALFVIHNAQVDNVGDFDLVMLKYNLIDLNNLNDLNNNITASELFRFNVRITRAIPAGGNTKDVEIALPLK